MYARGTAVARQTGHAARPISSTPQRSRRRSGSVIPYKHTTVCYESRSPGSARSVGTGAYTYRPFMTWEATLEGVRKHERQTAASARFRRRPSRWPLGCTLARRRSVSGKLAIADGLQLAARPPVKPAPLRCRAALHTQLALMRHARIRLASCLAQPACRQSRQWAVTPLVDRVAITRSDAGRVLELQS